MPGFVFCEIEDLRVELLELAGYKKNGTCSCEDGNNTKYEEGHTRARTASGGAAISISVMTL